MRPRLPCGLSRQLASISSRSSVSSYGRRTFSSTGSRAATTQTERDILGLSDFPDQLHPRKDDRRGRRSAATQTGRNSILGLSHSQKVPQSRQDAQYNRLRQTSILRRFRGIYRFRNSTLLLKGSDKEVVIERKSGNAVTTTVVGDRSDPDTWMRVLEPLLPVGLRTSAMEEQQTFEDVQDLLKILHLAEVCVGNQFDLLHHMLLKYGRDRAALYLLDKMLSDVSAPASEVHKVPSNVMWPDLLDLGSSTFDLDQPENTAKSLPLEDQYSDNDRIPTQRAVMRRILLSLGKLVIVATKTEASESRLIMSFVYQVLAKIHHCGLLPETIYDYPISPYSTTVNRPPVLHLLSGRILTILSDAVWRSQQDEHIARAAAESHSIEGVFKDPPGGRFRLRVRDLGPEVWLEFILWCCVEWRFGVTGASIVESLRGEHEMPWFAIHWTSNDLGHSVPLVDWQKVHMRTGGTVGRIESYSGEQPLAAVPERTISAEVVLALVESVVNTSGTLYQTTIRGGTMEQRISHHVQNLISFLEPHSLPTEYLDYLAIRLLQSDHPEGYKAVQSLSAMSSLLTELHDLERATPPELFKPTLAYRDIIAQSLTRVSLLQQSLMADIRSGLIFESTERFSSIQHFVDRSKVQNMLAFLQTSRQDDKNFFGGESSLHHQEYSGSHGQPPAHIMAAFLQHITENNELELAQWMLYSDDVDGPAISKRLFKEQSIARAVTRLATETLDMDLLQKIIQSTALNRRLKPSVKLRRAITDAQIRLMEFSRAASSLKGLRTTIAGGYSPQNLATLAATILRMELSSNNDDQSIGVRTKIRQARLLMTDILSGQYNATSGEFYRSQLSLFRRQVANVLQILQALPQSSVCRVAKAFPQFQVAGNAPNLDSATFNCLLSGIVDAHGVETGISIWKKFCQYPLPQDESQADHDALESFLTDVDIDEYADLEDDFFLPATEPVALYDEQELYPTEPSYDENPSEDWASESPNTKTWSAAQEEPLHPAFDRHMEHANDIAWSVQSEPSLHPSFGNDEEPPMSEISFTADIPGSDLMSQTTKVVSSAGTSDFDSDQPEDMNSKPENHVRDDQSKLRHCVVPNIHSVRIILRAAVRQPVEKAKAVKWASWWMWLLGRSKDEIEFELKCARQQTVSARS